MYFVKFCCCPCKNLKQVQLYDVGKSGTMWNVLWLKDHNVTTKTAGLCSKVLGRNLVFKDSFQCLLLVCWGDTVPPLCADQFLFWLTVKLNTVTSCSVFFHFLPISLCLLDFFFGVLVQNKDPGISSLWRGRFPSRISLPRMRLTLELLQQAPQSLNPAKHRQLLLRGFKWPGSKRGGGIGRWWMCGVSIGFC